MTNSSVFTQPFQKSIHPFVATVDVGHRDSPKAKREIRHSTNNYLIGMNVEQIGLVTIERTGIHLVFFCSSEYLAQAYINRSSFANHH